MSIGIHRPGSPLARVTPNALNRHFLSPSKTVVFIGPPFGDVTLNIGSGGSFPTADRFALRGAAGAGIWRYYLEKDGPPTPWASINELTGVVTFVSAQLGEWDMNIRAEYGRGAARSNRWHLSVVAP